jgi:hypothetical protein
MSLTVVSFCEESGEMVKPWLDAGYTCWIVDLKHPRGLTREGRLVRVGASVFELHPYHRWLPQEPRITAAFAFPVCTDLTYSGQRWRRENGPTATAEGFRLFAACWDLLRFYERERGALWMLENPRGIPSSWCSPDFKFDQWQYGDGESKETHLWAGGGFVMPPPSVVLKPNDVRESCWKMAPGPDRAQKRSVTPAGFARAVFEANHQRLEQSA